MEIKTKGKKGLFGFGVVGIFLFAVSVFYVLIGENSYIAVQDNLDLFLAQFAMLKNEGIFFSHGVSAPFLGGVSRDVLPSEFSLYTVIFMIFPPFAAYVVGYILKVIIAVVSCRLLFLDMTVNDKDNAHVQNLATLVGLLYGILNLFPAFAIPFASVPLIVFLLRKAYKNGLNRRLFGLILLIFCYPFISYFSYLGFFILGYLFVAIIWLWIKDRKLSISLVIALMALGLGYVAFEYRLFSMMLFSDAETIRETMVQTYLPFNEIIGESFDIFVNGMMHVDDLHRLFVMPLCLVYLVLLNVRYVVKKNVKDIFTDYYNLCFLIIVFNCLVYGLYYSKAVEHVIETLLPPLTGFQYNRTIFFNPFLWCAMLFILVYRLYKWLSIRQNKVKALIILPYMLIIVAALVVLFAPTKYNDLYHTAKLTVRDKVYGHDNDALNYREFYSTELFDEIKSDLKYEKGEYCVAYGMHPAILEYNGIYTLDGYLGFYPQSYKEAFREVIAPALERMEPTRLYYDEWGARCYLYSGTDLSIVMATKSMAEVTDNDIYINAAALKKLGCKYIISRIDISNTADVGIRLIGSYSNVSSPYTIYVYTIV
ncbi:hypothetical protein SAMN04487928_11813 [Butyrivibrio proteoclasticus]|uniref:Uncharacterized protein n=1 Tax=Butyrivibrio proteoclasticus TaxID=43305 RepID=A0A1I5VM98_9FIRM|nr:DUF6044 family protein [Butyrivibrio proteoclasticus]SFQ08619.1 hypothetical protein SAMN04487928_11813 [Butyrivibrio proteoclasticus]